MKPELNFSHKPISSMVFFMILTGHGMNDKHVTRAISLCKKIISCFSYSWKKRRHLAEVQMQMGLPCHQLITKSATHWGSRQQMTERVLEQEGALAKILSSDKKTRHPALSGEEYATLSYVKPVLHLFN